MAPLESNDTALAVFWSFLLLPFQISFSPLSFRFPRPVYSRYSLLRVISLINYGYEVSNSPIQSESSSKIRPLLELLAKIR